jgi:hypothetical protein
VLAVAGQDPVDVVVLETHTPRHDIGGVPQQPKLALTIGGPPEHAEVDVCHSRFMAVAVRCYSRTGPDVPAVFIGSPTFEVSVNRSGTPE